MNSSLWQLCIQQNVRSWVNEAAYWSDSIVCCGIIEQFSDLAVYGNVIMLESMESVIEGVHSSDCFILKISYLRFDSRNENYKVLCRYVRIIALTKRLFTLLSSTLPLASTSKNLFKLCSRNIQLLFFARSWILVKFDTNRASNYTWPCIQQSFFTSLS